jgi:hypothetical protein
VGKPFPGVQVCMLRNGFFFISFTVLFLSNIFFCTFVRSKLQKIRMKMIQQAWVSSASEVLPCLRNIGNFLRCCLSSFHIILPLVAIPNFIFFFQHIFLFRTIWTSYAIIIAKPVLYFQRCLQCEVPYTYFSTFLIKKDVVSSLNVELKKHS